jgi:aryl-alcohol dehydrogenase-like predicted oxidoreductase
MDPQAVNEAFTALRTEGKVRYFGVSNFTAAQFNMLASRVKVPLVTNQIEYSVMHMDAQADGTLDLCQQLGIRPMAWSPLGGGRLFHEDSAQAARPSLQWRGDVRPRELSCGRRRLALPGHGGSNPITLEGQLPVGSWCRHAPWQYALILRMEE